MNDDYVVKPGDTLSKIARSRGTTVDRLLELNPSLQNSPDRIRPGQSISLSAPTMNAGFSSFDFPSFDFSMPELPSFGLPSLPSYDDIMEAGGNARYALQRGLDALRDWDSGAREYIYDAAANAKREWEEETWPRIKHAATVYPAITPAALRYVFLDDGTVVEDAVPNEVRQALAHLAAFEEDRLRREGIQRYDVFQEYGGATDISGMNELPTNYAMDMAAKIFGGMPAKNIIWNDDGSVTYNDLYNVNLSTDLARQQYRRRLENSNGQNTSGAMLGALEYGIQSARNAMASVRPKMHDYELPPVGGMVHPKEREQTGYWNVANITAEEIQEARERGRDYVPPVTYPYRLAAAAIAPGPYAVSQIVPKLPGLLGFLEDSE